jgi:hypothetical protein
MTDITDLIDRMLKYGMPKQEADEIAVGLISAGARAAPHRKDTWDEVAQIIARKAQPGRKAH